MKIEHIAVWTEDIERLRSFYTEFFGAVSNEKYINPRKRFESYFLSFESGARLEIMKKPDIPSNLNSPQDQYLGLIHFAFEVDSKLKVDQMAQQFAEAGYTPIDGPRVTGDGYYEFTILDPDQNRVEVCTVNK